MRLGIRRMAIVERRKHEIGGCPEEYIPVRRHATLPPNCVEYLEKRRYWVMQALRSFPNLSEKHISPPLKMFLSTHLSLPVHESQPLPSPEIPPSPSSLPSAEPDLLGDN